MKGFIGGLVGLAVLVISGNARAGYVTFTSRAAFETAAYGLQTIGFEGLAPPGGVLTAEPSLTLDGVTFTGVIPGGNYLFVVDPAVFPPLYDWGSGASLLGPPTSIGAGSEITVTLPPGTTAFGTDLMTAGPFAAPFQVTLDDGQTFLVNTDNYPDRAFFGVTSDTPIASVSFVAGDGAEPLLDNFTVGLAAPVPPSLVLFGVGALGLATARKLYRKRLLPG
jgi:hypothetical protein